MRQNKKSYSATVPVPTVGPHAAVANLKSDGTLTLSLDEQPVVPSQSAGLFAQKPLDGLDVGSDQGGLVGSYEGPNPFTGTIKDVTVELAATE